MQKPFIVYPISLLILFIALFPSLSYSQSPKSDQDRVNDIHQIASIIEEYKKAKGHYPFSENWENVEKGMVAVPILVHMSSHRLPEQFQYPPPGMSGLVITTEEFEDYLSSGLKRSIKLPRDDRPIKSPQGNWPHFYQFQYDGQNYFLSCYLNSALPFARKLSENFYKYEVGSIEIPRRMTRKFSDIKTK